MSSVVISGDTSGSISLTVPSVAGSNTATLPAGTGTIAVQGVSTNIVSGTAQATTSGTSITFSSIPSWVKRITVMFNGVSTSGGSNRLVQIGSGSTTTSGYNSTTVGVTGGGSGASNSTSGFIVQADIASYTTSGHMVITLLSPNTWISSHSVKYSTSQCAFGGGDVSLSGALDRVVITTVNGTDTFDAGSINILYE
jgi:hypothetical protein